MHTDLELILLYMAGQNIHIHGVISSEELAAPTHTVLHGFKT